MEIFAGALAGALVGAGIGFWILKKSKKLSKQAPASTVSEMPLAGALNVPLAVPGFEGRNLTVRDGLWGPSVFIDNVRVKPSKGVFAVADNTGQSHALKLLSSVPFLDPAHELAVGRYRVRLQQPLAWYEYAVCCISILMMFVGGAIGGGAGAAACYFNIRIFRSGLPGFLKYIYALLIFLGAVAVWLILVVLIYTFIPVNPSS